MQDPPLDDGSADLIWAEGSVYIMAFDAALRSWRRESSALLMICGLSSAAPTMWPWSSRLRTEE
jgi:hypothetical protein